MGIFFRGAVSKYRVAAAYSKKNFGTLSEAFTVDDRSLLSVSFGYKLNEFVEAVLNRTTQFELDSATVRYESLNTISFMLNFTRKF